MKNKILSIVAFLFLIILPVHSQKKTVLAIIDFKNSTGELSYNYLQSAIPDMFATNLSQSTDITVLERERVEKTLKEAELALAGITEGKETKIGKLLSAEALVSGSLIKAGRVLRIDVRLFDVVSGKILASDTKQCSNADEIINSVDNLSESILLKITGKKISFTKDIDVKAATAYSSDAPVNIELLQENSFYPSNIVKPFFVRIGFIAGEVKAQKERIPLNICVVLDRSGSMDDAGKIDYARQAIQFIIKNLEKNDFFSLVLYDTNVEVLIKPTKVHDKNALIEIVKGISTRGSTNLSGGMMEGYEQVKKNISQNQVNRVLLISDGLANVGITDPQKIQQIAKAQSKSGISTSSFGVGQQFNEQLMTGIAEYGNANYYYISKSDKIPDIFSKELKGLLAVAAQNCTIEIETSADAKIETAYGFLYEQSRNGIIIKFGDLVSEEKKLTLVKFIPAKANKNNATIGRVTYSYDDVIAAKGRITLKKDIIIIYSNDSSLISKNINPIVMKDVDMFASAEMMEKTISMVDKGDLEEAKKNIDTNLNNMRSSLTRYQSRELKKQILNIYEYKSNLNQLSEQAASTADMMRSEQYQDMQKSQRSQQYELKKKK